MGSRTFQHQLLIHSAEAHYTSPVRREEVKAYLQEVCWMDCARLLLRLPPRLPPFWSPGSLGQREEDVVNPLQRGETHATAPAQKNTQQQKRPSGRCLLPTESTTSTRSLMHSFPRWWTGLAGGERSTEGIFF